MAKVEVTKKTVRGLGTSDAATLQAMFPTSPALPGANNGQYTDKDVADLVQQVMTKKQSEIADSNPDFPSFDPNYGEAPDLTTVEKAADGSLVWNHFSPPPGSPGTPNALGPAAALAVTSVPESAPVSSGAGSTRSPSETAKQIAQQFPGDKGQVAGNLSKGSSGAQS
jgi:hypothetical protein